MPNNMGDSDALMFCRPSVVISYLLNECRKKKGDSLIVTEAFQSVHVLVLCVFHVESGCVGFLYCLSLSLLVVECARECGCVLLPPVEFPSTIFLNTPTCRVFGD